MNIGNKIKELRKRRNMSQEKLGHELGVSQAMIAQYETGKRNPKIKTIMKIASILEVGPFELMSVDEYETLTSKYSVTKLISSKTSIGIKLEM